MKLFGTGSVYTFMIRNFVRPALPVLAGLLLLAGVSAAHAEISFGINIGSHPAPPPPPPPAAEVRYAPPGPGAYWVKGHWEWDHGRWVWWRGYWDYPPYRGAVWVPGATVFIDGRYVWRRAHWDHR